MASERVRETKRLATQYYFLMTEPNKKPKTVFIKKDGKILSDYTKGSVISGIKSGYLKKEDEISMNGKVWRPLDKNPSLAKLFASQKPDSENSQEARALENPSNAKNKPTKVDELSKLSELLKSGAISQEEYARLKAEIIEEESAARTMAY